MFSKKLLPGILALILCGAPSGCFKDKQDIRIAGSTTILPFMNRVSEEYAEQTDTDIQITSGGSLKGIESLISGRCDIAMCSWPISARLRTDAQSKGTRIKGFPFAHDMIVPIVHPSNPITHLTLDQLRGIYTGVVQSWAEVGGNPASIEVVIRSSSSGTAEVWKQVISTSNALKTGGVVESSNSGVLAYVAEHPNAIGYVSFAILNHEVKPLSINGAPPTVNSAKQGKYPILRQLYLYVDEDNLSYDVKSLIVFVLSARGQQIVSQCGLIPRDALK